MKTYVDGTVMHLSGLDARTACAVALMDAEGESRGQR